MGVVYKGYDPVIERHVALKTVRKELVDENLATQIIARFKNEALASGRLNHPAIVGIYDYGENKQLAYIAMEYVQGRGLRDFLARQERFGLQEVMTIMSRLLDALDYAHEHGVVHRDIKPQNIIMTPDGRLKLADFGIARIDRSNLTQVGPSWAPLRTCHRSSMQGSRWTGAATSFPAASSSTSCLPASSRLKARPRPSGTRYATNPTAILRKSILRAFPKFSMQSSPRRSRRSQKTVTRAPANSRRPSPRASKPVAVCLSRPKRPSSPRSFTRTDRTRLPHPRDGRRGGCVRSRSCSRPMSARWREGSSKDRRRPPPMAPPSCAFSPRAFGQSGTQRCSPRRRSRRSSRSRNPKQRRTSPLPIFRTGRSILERSIRRPGGSHPM